MFKFIPGIPGYKFEHNGQLYVRYSTKKGVKYLKCVVESCPGRATVKKGVIHTTGEHVQHDDLKEEIDRLKISSECRKRAAEDDSHTLRQIFDEVRDRRLMSILQKERLSTYKREMSRVI